VLQRKVLDEVRVQFALELAEYDRQQQAERDKKMKQSPALNSVPKRVWNELVELWEPTEHKKPVFKYDIKQDRKNFRVLLRNVESKHDIRS
jgi:hypothetical protein